MGRAADDQEVGPGDQVAVAPATGTRVTSWVARRPSAMLLATACVFPYIDSYTTSARMLITSLTSLPSAQPAEARRARSYGPGQ